MKHSKRLLSSLFYVPKYEKVSDKSFSRIVLSSVFGMLICGICLAGLTWAWFSETTATSTQTIKTPEYYQITFAVKCGTDDINCESEGNYTLSSDKTYSVTLSATGTTGATGYCKIISDGKEFYTEQIFAGGTLTFTVNNAVKMQIIPKWGTCAVAATAENLRIGSQPDTENHIVNRIGTPPEVMTAAEALEQSEGTGVANTLTDTEQSYTVQQGDTLSEIANRYGTTAAVLSAYNNIENAAEIQAGATLKIPPANVADEITDSKTQSVPDTDTTVAATDEP